MKISTTWHGPSFAALQLSAMAFFSIFVTTSALADTRVSINCTIDKFRPSGPYTVRTLKGWVSERMNIEISDSNQVEVTLASGARFQGEVNRENSKKISIVATRKVTDHLGRKTYMTYTLEWFKSNNKIFVDVLPQGYQSMGTAKGNCKAATASSASQVPSARASDATARVPSDTSQAG